MGRSIASAIVGYVVMFVGVVLGMMVLWAMFGVEGAFEEGTAVASTKWSVGACVFGFFAAVAGGIVAMLIDKSPNLLGAKILMGFMLVMGIVGFVAQSMKEIKPLPKGKSMADIGFVEAGEYAVSPTWYNAIIPVVGIAGVLTACKMIRPASPEMLIADSQSIPDQLNG